MDTSSLGGSRLYRKGKAWAWHQALASCLIFGNRPNFSKPPFFFFSIHGRDPNANAICVLGGLNDIKSIKQLQRTHTGKHSGRNYFLKLIIINAYVPEIVTYSKDLLPGL